MLSQLTFLYRAPFLRGLSLFSSVSFSASGTDTSLGAYRVDLDVIVLAHQPRLSSKQLPVCLSSSCCADGRLGGSGKRNPGHHTQRAR